MSGSTKLVEPIEGYTVSIFWEGGGDNPIYEDDLKLSKVGGAHITNPDSLITLLEDAVFKHEEKIK
jgi:hypothetical protein